MHYLLRLLHDVVHTITRALHALIGDISWRPPGWLQRCYSTCRRHQRLSVASLLAVVLVASAGVWTWRWYERKPRPHRVITTVAPVPVTPLEKTLRFPPLRISFNESAARLEDLQQPSLRRVQLSPALPG